MTGVLNSVFGAPVTITPPGLGAQPVVLSGMFREDPQEIETADGRRQLVTLPTLRLRRDQAAPVTAGALVEPSSAPGRSFRVRQFVPTGSPAADGFLLIELEAV